MYPETDENFFKENYIKGSTSVSNNVFERKLFDGFKIVCGEHNFTFLSAPSFGWYPFNCKKMVIKGRTDSHIYHHVQYISTYFGSAFSKTHSFKKQLSKVCKDLNSNNTKVCLVINELHLPYLECAKYMKKKYKNVSVVQLVPDLPQHNNRSKSFIYKLLKKINCTKIEKLRLKFVDKYVLFSLPMADKLEITNKNNWIVNYGIAPKKHDFGLTKNSSKVKHIVFIGKIDNRNGIDLIIKVAEKFRGQTDIVFDLYGIGASDAFNQETIKNNNIVVHGFLTPSKVQEILSNADVLLSPRYPAEEYTKYSFPSKIFEYLATDVPIVTFKLECYPRDLDSLLIYPKDINAESLFDSVNLALRTKVDLDARKRFLSNFSEEAVVKKIMELCDV